MAIITTSLPRPLGARNSSRDDDGDSPEAGTPAGGVGESQRPAGVARRVGFVGRAERDHGVQELAHRARPGAEKDHGRKGEEVSEDFPRKL